MASKINVIIAFFRISAFITMFIYFSSETHFCQITFEPLNKFSDKFNKILSYNKKLLNQILNIVIFLPKKVSLEIHGIDISAKNNNNSISCYETIIIDVLNILRYLFYIKNKKI